MMYRVCCGSVVDLWSLSLYIEGGVVAAVWVVMVMVLTLYDD